MAIEFSVSRLVKNNSWVFGGLQEGQRSGRGKFWLIPDIGY
jgi:hypothetical protein